MNEQWSKSKDEIINCRVIKTIQKRINEKFRQTIEYDSWDKEILIETQLTVERKSIEDPSLEKNGIG